MLLFLITSCAKTPAEEVDQAIDVALSYLQNGECDEAIDLLEDLGRTTSNPDYLQVLASGYACRAGYNEITFLSTEINKIDSVNLLPSLTTFTLANDTEADSDSYVDMKEALDILLNTDTSQPTQDRRVTRYGPRKAGDMGFQILFLALTQLGKFVEFYGNVDSLGNKGQGAASTDEQGATPSTCFLEYNDARALTFLGLGGGGVCNNMATDDGHPNLIFAPAPDLAKTKIRMCDGLILVNNIIDLLENLDLPAEYNLDTLATTVAAYKTAIIAADSSLTTLMNTTSQSECETLMATPSEFDNLQYIYALLFEAGLP